MEDRINEKWKENEFNSIIAKVPKSKGIYAIVFKISKSVRLYSIKMFKNRVIEKGLYVYIGSARGPGGLRARIKRHLMKKKRRKWHIDYLTTLEYFKPIAIIYAITDQDLEYKVSELLSNYLPIPVRKFGSTDKPSKAHLFKCNEYNECINILCSIFKSLNLSPKVIYFYKVNSN